MENKAPDVESVDIRPGVGLYALFPSLRYTPWVALGEMVDNSIQSYIQHKEELIALNGPDYKLRVDINFSGGENPTIQLIMPLGFIRKILDEHLHLQCRQRTERVYLNTALE
jgi:hypothetical protein